jgi:flagellar protein FliJ
MFRFRLAPVLRLREAAEETRKRALAEALAALDARRKEFSELEKERERCRERLVREGGGISIAERSLYAGYMDRLSRRKAEIVAKLEEEEARVEKRRSELAVAARDRQAMERLRDRRAEAWRRTEERRDRARSDELAVLGFGRRRTEEESFDAN